MRTRRTGKEGLHTRVKQTKEVNGRDVIEEQMDFVNTTVYVLSHNIQYEGSYVVGIYSSVEEAEDAKQSFILEKDINEDYEGTLDIEPARVDYNYWEED
jgi:hypothetical protein